MKKGLGKFFLLEILYFCQVTQSAARQASCFCDTDFTLGSQGCLRLIYIRDGIVQTDQKCANITEVEKSCSQYRTQYSYLLSCSLFTEKDLVVRNILIEKPEESGLVDAAVVDDDVISTFSEPMPSEYTTFEPTPSETMPSETTSSEITSYKPTPSESTPSSPSETTTSKPSSSESTSSETTSTTPRTPRPYPSSSPSAVSAKIIRSVVYSFITTVFANRVFTILVQ